MQHDVVLLTEKQYLAANQDEPYVCQLQLEESLLAHALRQRGLTVMRQAWDAPDMPWQKCGALIFRSTWNYFFRYQEFAPWLLQVSEQTRLFNSAQLIQWNIDKHYLLHLQHAGVRIPATVMQEAGETRCLQDIMTQNQWDEVVIKPAISGSARLTYRVNKNSLVKHESIWQECCAQEAMMVQPFLSSVMNQGEVSLIVIDGEFSHAIRKLPKTGDFRVQDDHGGYVVGHEACDDERAFAEKAIRACPELPLYARVDVVRDHNGDLCLMELEMIEPELFLRFYTPAAALLADAIVRRLRQQ